MAMQSSVRFCPRCGEPPRQIKRMLVMWLHMHYDPKTSVFEEGSVKCHAERNAHGPPARGAEVELKCGGRHAWSAVVV